MCAGISGRRLEILDFVLRLLLQRPPPTDLAMNAVATFKEDLYNIYKV
jgi:hypothetical protein